MTSPLVRDRMSSPVITVPEAMPLPKLTELLLAEGISAVPVVDPASGDGLVGIVSTTDLLDGVARGEGREARCAREVMQTPVVTLPPEAPIEAAATIFARERLHRIVVVDGARVLGILTPVDLIGDVKARADARPLSTLMVRAIASVDLGTPVDEAIAVLARAQVHGIAVVDGLKPVGVLTHREALFASSVRHALPASLQKQPVEEIMSYETICLDDDTPIGRAAAYVDAMNVRRVFVVKNRHTVGIVSAIDLAVTLAG